MTNDKSKPRSRIQIESESPEFYELAKRTGILVQVFCAAEKKAAEAEGREPMDFVHITATTMTWAVRSLAGRKEVKLYQQAVQLQLVRYQHDNQLARAMIEAGDATATSPAWENGDDGLRKPGHVTRSRSTSSDRIPVARPVMQPMHSVGQHVGQNISFHQITVIYQ